ncbi:hypothetical protein NL676_033827 [Syzygium grande]|nr:hypothetical protein NL676_033827 [Syzygium grande]
MEWRSSDFTLLAAIHRHDSLLSARRAAAVMMNRWFIVASAVTQFPQPQPAPPSSHTAVAVLPCHLQ